MIDPLSRKPGHTSCVVSNGYENRQPQLAPDTEFQEVAKSDTERAEGLDHWDVPYEIAGCENRILRHQYADISPAMHTGHIIC
jgi:hypothetical protein